MSQPPTEPESAAAPEQALATAEQALRLVCLVLPHLSGLAYEVRLQADPRVAAAGVFPSGRLVLNPTWFGQLSRGEAAFVLAHELLHLALRTHERADDGEHALFNEAHDYVINDILSEVFGRPPPAGGLTWPGAREQSAEHLVNLLRQQGLQPGQDSWSSHAGPTAESPLADALRSAGLLPLAPPPTGSDVLTGDLERAWFPDVDPADERRARQRVESAARKAVSLDLLRKRLEGVLGGTPSSGGDPGDEAAVVETLRSLYRPPWELALQRWLESIAPGPRTYLRPSRRGADRPDLVLPGRAREGWTLHLVLDTSGSMVDELPRLLGAIASFCEAVNIGQVHLLQCDAEVTRDEYVDPEELLRYTVEGFGGSDLSPALERLAEDPEVEAAVVLTDGYIDYPERRPPFEILWALTESNEEFEPPYGRRIVLEN